MSKSDISKEEFIRVGTTLYKLVNQPRLNGGYVKKRIVWNNETLRQDYGKHYLATVPKYDGFCTVPDHVNYRPIVEKFLNLYESIDHKPMEGDFPSIRSLVEHIFGEQYELGMDYLQLLYLRPIQKLPILLLVSEERNTGKSTFLNFLKALSQNNVTFNTNEDFRSQSYQDTYAQAMNGYGLQRGIDGSEARHISTRQYYRDLVQQTEQLRTDIGQLKDRKETAQEELKRAKKEVQTEKLKGAATTAATNIAESVGPLFGSNKVKTLERENTTLHKVVATYEETIETLQTRIQTMQADHNRQVLGMQQKHIKELQIRDTEHKKEVSMLTALLNKTLKWFPQIKDMLNLERVCLAVGFSQEQTAVLMMGKPLGYSGELYSEEHKRKFMAKDVNAKVFSDNGRLILTIDLRPIGEWFKEQFEKLQQRIHRPVSPQRKDRGMKL